jgi:protein phosphatase 1A
MLLMSQEFFFCRIKFKDDLIISSPDVSLVELGPDVEFVLLATDGLWDYIKRSIQVPFIFMYSLPFKSL